MPHISIIRTQPLAENLIQDTGMVLVEIVIKEADHFIRACAYFELVNSCSHEVQQLLHMIESDTLFLVFLDFWELGDIPDQDGYSNILICLDFMTGFVLGEFIGMK